MIDHILMLAGTTHGLPQILTCLKRAFLRAGTEKISPVRGFRAFGLGGVSLTLRAPNPRISMRFPAIKHSRSSLNTLSTISRARAVLQLFLSTSSRARSFFVIVVKTIRSSQGGWDSRESRYMPKDLSTRVIHGE